MTYLIVFCKAVEDKNVGIYIEGIYFGGIEEGRQQAKAVARECVNGTRGGTAIPNIIPLSKPNSLAAEFATIRERYNRLERQMFETEQILEANQTRKKRSR